MTTVGTKKYKMDTASLTAPCLKYIQPVTPTYNLARRSRQLIAEIDRPDTPATVFLLVEQPHYKILVSLLALLSVFSTSALCALPKPRQIRLHLDSCALLVRRLQRVRPLCEAGATTRYINS